LHDPNGDEFVHQILYGRIIMSTRASKPWQATQGMQRTTMRSGLPLRLASLMSAREIIVDPFSGGDDVVRSLRTMVSRSAAIEKKVEKAKKDEHPGSKVHTVMDAANGA